MDNHGLSDMGEQADDLTWREQEILILLAERLTNREIAEHLYLAESTVKDYLGKFFSKLYVKNRRQAVERAKALGLLDSEQKTSGRQPSRLPSERTSFVGRRKELEEIKRLIGETRLLTLTGPGGIGKTRLALKAGEEVANDFEDGVYFIPLAPIRSAEHITQTIAEGVKFPLATQENPQRQLLRYLRKKRLLLVVDNFEHLLDSAEIVSAILQAAPAVKILATSRERLNLQGETNLIIGGMGFSIQAGSEDMETGDAITLFILRARQVFTGFDPSPGGLEQIVKICQIVQGMPLAIELAAAWLHILNVYEIAQELEKGLGLLTTELRDAPERHRSIHAVFDHSWSLLSQIERETFMRLSVFRGGFTREAAQHVAGASLQLLAGLVNKSFLSCDPGSGRFEIHELLRQCAQEQLEKEPDASALAHKAHAVYYAAFMQERWGDLRGYRQMLLLGEIEADIENVRTAWRYCLDQRSALQMWPQLWMFIYGLWYVYWIRWWNHAGMDLFAEAVRVLEGDEAEEAIPLRALAMAFQGYYMAWLDLADQGFQLAKEAVEILEVLNYPEALAFAYDSLGVNAYFLSHYKEEAQAAAQMLKVAAEVEDPWLQAFTLFAVGMGALFEKDYPKAKRVAEKNLKLFEDIGDAIGSTMPLIVLGHVALVQGAYEDARGYYLRCLKMAEKTSFYYSIQTASKYLGKVCIALGRIEEAEHYLFQSLTISKEIGFIRDIVNLLYEIACLRAVQGDSEGAVQLLGLVIRYPVSHQTRWLGGRIKDDAESLLGKLAKGLSSEAYTAAFERGQDLDLDGVIEDLVGTKGYS